MGEIKFNITSSGDAIANGDINIIEATFQSMGSIIDEGNVLILEKFQSKI